MGSKKKAAVTKAETATTAQVVETVKKVGQLTIEGASKKVTEASLSIGKVLAEATAQLQAQLQEFEQVSLALEAKKKELEGVYGTEQLLKEIGELEADFENKKIQLEQDFELFQNQQSAERSKIELERQQEEADFKFNLDEKRREEQLKFDEAQRTKSNELRDQEELRKKNWTEREENLAKAEKELTELRTKAEGFSAQVEAAVKKAESILGNVLKKDFEHKLELAQKDADTAKLVSENTIKSLEARLANLDKVNTELTVQVTTAQAKVAEIAKDALTAASSTKSLADVQQLIQTQANGGQPRKT